jgi:hypothetical protein
MPEDVQAVSDAVVQVRERLQAEVDAEVCPLNPKSGCFGCVCDGGRVHIEMDTEVCHRYPKP